MPELSQLRHQINRQLRLRRRRLKHNAKLPHRLIHSPAPQHRPSSMPMNQMRQMRKRDLIIKPSRASIERLKDEHLPVIRCPLAVIAIR